MTTKEELWLVLSDLTAEQFKQFRWFLKDAEDGFTAIPGSRLDTADHQDAVDLMVQQYGSVHKALQKTTKTLEKIQRKDLVQRLSALTSQRNVTNRTTQEEMKERTRLMIKERQVKMSEIQRWAQRSRKSAERQIADNTNAAAALIQSVQRSMNQLTGEIKERQQTAQKRADRLLRELRQEVCELEKRLCAGDDPGDDHASRSDSWGEVGAPRPSWEESVTAAVSRLSETLDRELKTFLSRARLTWARQFAVDVTLDPNTAHPNLVLSRDRTQVYCGAVRRELPDNPERFDTAPNVLGEQGFSSGSFYFQVQVGGKTAWDVGVVTGSIGRKGSIKAAPADGFWTICLRNAERYKAAGVHLTVEPPVNIVGVFVDIERGFVSFHNVDSAELIHRFTDLSFKEKLFPFLSPSNTQGGLNSRPLVLIRKYNRSQIDLTDQSDRNLTGAN